MSTPEIATFLEAADMFADLCSELSATEWSQPGLGEWDVRALAGHTLRAVTTVGTYLAQSPPDRIACETAGAYFLAVREVAGADDRSVAERGHLAGEALAHDPMSVVRTELARTRETLRQVQDASTIIPTVVGGMRLRDYLPTRTFELLAHSLDLATAVDIVLDPPPAVLAAAVATAVDALLLDGEGVTLLRALIGRAPGLPHPLFG